MYSLIYYHTNMKLNDIPFLIDRMQYGMCSSDFFIIIFNHFSIRAFLRSDTAAG